MSKEIFGLIHVFKYNFIENIRVVCYIRQSLICYRSMSSVYSFKVKLVPIITIWEKT
jgi:hypothetical protein